MLCSCQHHLWSFLHLPKLKLYPCLVFPVPLSIQCLVIVLPSIYKFGHSGASCNWDQIFMSAFLHSSSNFKFHPDCYISQNLLPLWQLNHPCLCTYHMAYPFIVNLGCLYLCPYICEYVGFALDCSRHIYCNSMSDLMSGRTPWWLPQWQLDFTLYVCGGTCM